MNPTCKQFQSWRRRRLQQLERDSTSPPHNSANNKYNDTSTHSCVDHYLNFNNIHDIGTDFFLDSFINNNKNHNDGRFSELSSCSSSSSATSSTSCTPPPFGSTPSPTLPPLLSPLTSSPPLPPPPPQSAVADSHVSALQHHRQLGLKAADGTNVPFSFHPFTFESVTFYHSSLSSNNVYANYNNNNYYTNNNNSNNTAYNQHLQQHQQPLRASSVSSSSSQQTSLQIQITTNNGLDLGQFEKGLRWQRFEQSQKHRMGEPFTNDLLNKLLSEMTELQTERAKLLLETKKTETELRELKDECHRLGVEIAHARQKAQDDAFIRTIYQEAFNEMDLPVLVIDAAREAVLLHNKAFETFFGYSLSDLARPGWQDFFDPRDQSFLLLDSINTDNNTESSDDNSNNDSTADSSDNNDTYTTGRGNSRGGQGSRLPYRQIKIARLFLRWMIETNTSTASFRVIFPTKQKTELECVTHWTLVRDSTTGLPSVIIATGIPIRFMDEGEHELDNTADSASDFGVQQRSETKIIHESDIAAQ